jgi:hypothetical protein
LPAVDTKKSRKNDLTVGTAYNNMCAYKKQNPESTLF